MNRIQFCDGTGLVCFESSEIDIDAYMTRCDDVEFVYAEGVKLDNDDQRWWQYLSSNSYVEDDKLYIDFGNGRAAHTWQDFQWTVGQVKMYVKQPRNVGFQIADASDDFCMMYHEPVAFWP